MWEVSDRKILRELAKQVAEIHALPEIELRRARWMQHNMLRSTEPMLLVFPEGAWEELLPPESLLCHSEQARAIEAELRRRVYTFRHFHDDSVIEAEWVVDGQVSHTGWGVAPRYEYTGAARGAYRIEPVLNKAEDFDRLHLPDLLYDAAEHERRMQAAHDLFGDILTIRRKGVAHISYHLWRQYLDLRGEAAYMTDFVDAPEMIHRAMRFFTTGHQRLLAQMVEANLLSLNNDNTYHSSGGNGYTSELPAPGFDPQAVHPCDLWASAESLELAGVSPRMHRQFALDYERELLAPFGLTGYGCCEDLSRKLEDVLSVPNMRRVSISPFASVEACAAVLGRRAIFSWKPQPADLVGDWNPERVRGYLRHAIHICREHGCVLEIILKDTHTCEQHPERFDAWTVIAREEIEKVV